MAPTPRCGCLISYKMSTINMYLTRLRVVGLVFLLESCKKSGIVAEMAVGYKRVAKQSHKLHIVVV